MTIDPQILREYGAFLHEIKKGEFVFLEDDFPRFYYQVETGVVRIISNNSNGREHFHRLCSDGDSFGVSSIFVEKPYTVAAVASENSKVFLLSKDLLVKMIEENSKVVNIIIKYLSEQISEKCNTIQLLTNTTPEERILGFLKKSTKTEGEQTLVPYTRQQIADFTGLRVETVIRTLSRLNQQKKVNILNRKIYY
jgi:CRP-like cAMP-binding protein